MKVAVVALAVLGVLGGGGWYGWTLHERVGELEDTLRDVYAQMEDRDAEIAATALAAESTASRVEDRVSDLERDVGSNFEIESLSDRLDALERRVTLVRFDVDTVDGCVDRLVSALRFGSSFFYC